MSPIFHLDQKKRRDRLRDEQKCINGRRHAPPEPGHDKCAWCIAVHKRGVLAVLEDPDAPPRPEGYVFRPRAHHRQREIG